MSGQEIGYHAILGMYGFWLPNDPRGSMSDFVRSRALYKHGPATKVDSRRSVAHDPHDVVARLKAKESLKHPPVILDGKQAIAVGRGFADAIGELNLVVRACSIPPEHVHLVFDANAARMGKIIGLLRGRATKRLWEEESWPVDRPVWAEGRWIVNQDDEAQMLEAIEYVEQNPIKEGKRRQVWSFVTPLAGGVPPLRPRKTAVDPR